MTPPGSALPTAASVQQPEAQASGTAATEPASALEPSLASSLPPWWQTVGLDREVVLFTKAALDAAQAAAAATAGDVK